eukprot:3133422-Alexandrium_andersonii.AAC.1
MYASRSVELRSIEFAPDFLVSRSGACSIVGCAGAPRSCAKCGRQAMQVVDDGQSMLHLSVLFSGLARAASFGAPTPSGDVQK